MNIKEQTIRELETMKPSEIYLVYEIIRSIKTREQRKIPAGSPGAYQRARLILKALRTKDEMGVKSLKKHYSQQSA